MRTFEKRYVIPGGNARRVAFQLKNYVGRFNHRKMGRNRRGMLMLAGARGGHTDEGDFEVVLEFCTEISPYGRIVGTGRFQVYQFADLRKPLRALAKADRLKNA